MSNSSLDVKVNDIDKNDDTLTPNNDRVVDNKRKAPNEDVPSPSKNDEEGKKSSPKSNKTTTTKGDSKKRRRMEPYRETKESLLTKSQRTVFVSQLTQKVRPGSEHSGAGMERRARVGANFAPTRSKNQR